MKDLVIFVKSNEKIIRIAEGNGCNLTNEDIDEGYVDYLYYDVFDAQDFQDVEDGGMVLLKKPIKEEFNSVGEVLQRVFDFIYPHPIQGYSSFPTYYMLSGEDDWTVLVGKEED